MQLSKFENKVYETMKKNNLFLFRIRDLCLLLGLDRTKAYNIVKSLKKKGVIKNIGKRFFAFADVDELSMATAIHYPSYISFWTALNYYGFSDNVPKKIFLATTKYSKEVGNFKYITLSKKRFFGYTKVGELTIAEKEKAILDSLLFPKYSGGIKEVEKSIENAINSLDIKKLIEYSFKLKSKIVIKRLGFILDRLVFKEKKIVIKKLISRCRLSMRLILALS